jgi:hypothetical protein
VVLAGGVGFDFAAGEVRDLEPGGYAVVVENLVAFNQRYGLAGIQVAGQYRGRLDNSRDTIRLEGPHGGVILEFTYEDAWEPAADGLGRSLVIRDELAGVETWKSGSAWRASDSAHGSPGRGEPASGGRQLPGDANRNGFIEIGDAVTCLLLLYRAEGRAPPCDGAGIVAGGNLPLFDYNGDEDVDLADVIYLLSHLFREGDAHVLGKVCRRFEGCPDECLK